MKKAALVARLIYGLMWLVFSLSFFFHFLPQPPPPESGLKFLSGLMAAPYFFPVLKLTELTVGILLLANIAVPLALVLISPIVIQIFLYHTFLDLSGAPVAVALVAFNVFLGIAYWANFKPLFKKV